MIQVDSSQVINIKAEVCPLIFPKSPKAWIYLTWAWSYDLCKRHWWNWYTRQIPYYTILGCNFDHFPNIISAQDQHTSCCIPWDLQDSTKFVKVLSLCKVKKCLSMHELEFCFETLNEKSNLPRNLYNKSRLF